MKRSAIIILFISLTFQGLVAQNVDDALRYSQTFYLGTARFMSMGGAFTALGGDMSSFSQNPAGIGVLRSSEISFTPQLMHNNTSASFHGINKDYLYNFNIGQAGVVSNLISNSGTTGLLSLNVGYSFNKTNNLNSAVRIEGISPSGSLADYWANSSYGTRYTDLSGAAGIAYDAWLIDTITGSGQNAYGTVYDFYGDNLSSDYGQNVRRYINNEGYTGEHAISIGGNYSNKIFFGATIGINRIKYTGHYEHFEEADYYLDSGFKNFTYTEHFENTGTGVSFKIGTIIKPTEEIRIGFAVHSPIYYKIDEYYYDNVSSNFTDNSHYEYNNDPLRYNYAMTTPFRALAGFAYQFKKSAIFSIDYEFVDYSTAKFSETGDNYDYSIKNREIKNTLRPASNIRAGGEYRLDKFYFRGGYGYYGKAFETGELNDKMDHRTISFGIGFREQNINLDFGFTNLKSTQDYIVFDPLVSNAAVAGLTSNRNIFSFTMGYKFGY